MNNKYITTVQDLIDLLNTIEDKSRPIRIQGIIGQDENSRNEYAYFHLAEIWDWRKDDNPVLVLR